MRPITSSVSASLLLFQTLCRFDYAVIRAQSPRQVITPGDGGAGQLFAAQSIPSDFIYCLCPSAASLLMCCQRSSRGHVFLLHIRVLPAQNYLRINRTAKERAGALSLYFLLDILSADNPVFYVIAFKPFDVLQN